MNNSAFFCGKQQIPWQTANSAAWRENLCAVEYCWLWLSVKVDAIKISLDVLA